MIGQLILRQDNEDKKKIGLYGFRTAKQMLNPVLANESPKGKHLKTAQHQNKEDDNCDHKVLQINKACLSCNSGNSVI
jgi:hypothetical protein